MNLSPLMPDASGSNNGLSIAWCASPPWNIGPGQVSETDKVDVRDLSLFCRRLSAPIHDGILGVLFTSSGRRMYVLCNPAKPSREALGKDVWTMVETRKTVSQPDAVNQRAVGFQPKSSVASDSG